MEKGTSTHTQETHAICPNRLGAGRQSNSQPRDILLCSVQSPVIIPWKTGITMSALTIITISRPAHLQQNFLPPSPVRGPN
jgi:hypothetical protein